MTEVIKQGPRRGHSRRNSDLKREQKSYIYSAAWLKDIPVKEGERVSVYISQPVPKIIRDKRKTQKLKCLLEEYSKPDVFP